MVSFFKEKSPAAVFDVIAVSICLHVHFFISPPAVIANSNEGLSYYLLLQLQALPSVALAVIYQIILVVQALMINFVLNDARMFSKPAFTTALAYILLASLLPQWNNITTAFAANCMLIWLLYSVIKIYNSLRPKTAVYNAGLIAGSTVLLYYASAPVVLLLFFAVGILRPFRINEWVVLFLGIITPAYFFAGYLFLTGKMDMVQGVLKIFYPHVIHPENILHISVTFITVILIIMFGVYVWQKNSSRMVVQIRKNWVIIFMLLLLLVPPVFFLPDAWPGALLPAALPAAAFVSNAFLYPHKNTVPAIFFWLLAAVVIYNNWW